MSAARVYWHDDALAHDTGSGMFDQPSSPILEVPELHPENAERVPNLRAALRSGPIAGRLEWHAGRHASREELEMLHLPAYIDSVQEFCAAGGGLMTQSTPVVERSWDAALAAAGTTLEATSAVLDGECDLAYALVRPPGHHAQPDRADGYCLFSNAARPSWRGGGAQRASPSSTGTCITATEPNGASGTGATCSPSRSTCGTGRGGRRIPRPARPTRSGSATARAGT